MATLSVVMIVKNEAANLRRCLPRLATVADEIVILDSGSTDESAAVAAEHGARWFVNSDWQGYGVQRQRAQVLATGEWIFALDADEVPDDTLLAALARIKDEAPGDTVYGARRLDMVFGRFIDHPRWRNKPFWRVYPRRFVFNDNAVHESLDISGARTAVLPGFLEHHTAATPAFWLAKRFAYANTWAEAAAARGKRVSPFGVWLRSFWAFFKQYFADGRFLRGSSGWVYAWLFAQYTFNKYALLCDRNTRPQSYAADFQPHAVNVRTLPLTAPPAGKNPYPLSVVMIVKNEARHLPACLAAVRDIADEIVILDSGSSDASAAIAARFGARWYENRDWRGFGMQRQRAQTLASGDYVLMLDADEQPDATLKAAILAVVQQPPAPGTVYALRRSNIFCGVDIYRRYRDRISRLYPRAHFQYHPYEVHESLADSNATVITLPGDLLHFTNDNLAHFLAKNLRYSHVWALEKAAGSKKVPSLWTLPLRAAVAFCREYFVRGAVFAGRYGFFLAASSAFYNFNKYLMLACDVRRERES